MANVPTIAVIDYHKGNLSSVARGLARAGAEALVTDDPAQIRTADALVLPGVGSFYDAIAFMHESGQDEAVLDAVRGGAGVPFLAPQLNQPIRTGRALPRARSSRPRAAAGRGAWDCCTARAPFCPRGASRCRTWAGTRSI